ncbi:MAG: hypothetical protein KatS3mg124_1217 [Porticoccaceae bacterium]|nr:MAG: hypothetical protein KatS3mg124_1217 [Porticoccaceae bacterium]
MSGARLTLPNLLSGSRLAAVPLLLALAAAGAREAYLVLLAAALATDALDGFFARRLQQTSPFGVKLDSFADLAVYLAMGVALWWLWPEIFRRELPFLALGASAYLVPVAASLLKFGSLPRYHTWSAKAAAALFAVSYYLLCLWDFPWLFRLAIGLHLWVALEALLLVWVLERDAHDIPSLWHALREKRKRTRREGAGSGERRRGDREG